MRPKLNEIDLYFITDSRLTKKTVLENVKSAIKAGVKIVQYREKEKSTGEMVEEAIQAEKLGADYIGVSPIFETKTKLDAGPSLGIKLIKDIKKSVNIPVVAIGGINLENIDGVIRTGMTSIAAISAIVTKEDIGNECRKFINKLKNNF